MTATMSVDARRVLAAQALRAFGYGLTSVLLGVVLDRLGFSGVEAGLVLTAVVAGTVAMSLLVARHGDRFGRRRWYRLLYLLLAGCGVAFAFARSPWVLALVALSGALSTEVVESGPFTSLEQAMLAENLATADLVRGFGLYNAVAAAAGALGALSVGALGFVEAWPAQRWFLVLVPIALAGAAVAGGLGPEVESPAARSETIPTSGLGPSRGIVVRLASLFALDSFGGGFVVQSFVAFWLARRFDASTGAIGTLFFSMGVLQTLSFLAAPRVARRFGLLATMVGTHLPSNVLLGAVAFSPSFGVAATLLLARVTLSQMDVPTRQAYVMTLVDPTERVPAAAYTNTARYAVRPAGPALAGAAQQVALGAPFLVAGTVKIVYDLVLWSWFRRVPLPDDQPN